VKMYEAIKPPFGVVSGGNGVDMHRVAGEVFPIGLNGIVKCLLQTETY